MKKIIFIFIILVTIFIIYTVNKDNKIYYLSLGDNIYDYNKKVYNYLKENKKLELYNNYYYKKYMTIIDLIDMIEDNAISNKISIQNALIKADIVTLSMGLNDITSKLNFYYNYSDNEIYNYLDEYVNDLEKLIKILRIYCKEKIVFLGYYNITSNNELDKYYIYLNKKVEKLLNQYNIIYLDLFNMHSKEDIGKEIVKCLKNTCQT